MKDGKETKQLTDEQISSQPQLPRRSFLAKTGAMLLGAAAVVSATRAGALTGYQEDSDAKKASDPDSKKGTGKKKMMKAKASDPDAKDHKKKTMAKSKKKTESGDPDKAKQPH